MPATPEITATAETVATPPIPAPPATPENPAEPEVEVAQPQALELDSGVRYRVSGVEFLGMVTFPTGYTVAETEVGGLSDIAYDPATNLYYLLSDDRSQLAPARVYVASVDLAGGELAEDGVIFQYVIPLRNVDGLPYAENTLDPEGMALTAQGTFFVASEGNAGVQPPIRPFVDEFSLDGSHLRSLPLPLHYLPDGGGMVGVRNNQAFEGLTLTPDGRYLVTAVENALNQDGPQADLEQESPSRVLFFDLATGAPAQEMVYVVDAVPVAPEPANGTRDNGLVELAALDANGTFLALERSFSEGKGVTARLYAAYTQGALDVRSLDRLASNDGDPWELDPPIRKQLLVDFAHIGVIPDNLEGMALGPALPDGRLPLLVVSDNNFSEVQTTQLIALALTVERVPTALAALETLPTLDDEDAPEGVLAGDADDPAIWLHPSDPAQSLVIATLKDGGLVVFNLAGEVVQVFAPEEYGDFRYNNVDLIYGFSLGAETVDLAVVSDRENDTLAVYRIDPVSGQLSDVTSPSMIETIFGEDDSERTAYGLAAYTSPRTGAVYVFVSQGDGNRVAQLQLAANASGQVEASIVRTLELPMIGEEAAESQSEGMVVDRELGFVYVAMEDGRTIHKFAAEPDGGAEPLFVFTHESLLPDVEGLAIYYGANGAGYLLVSSQGDSSYALFDRQGDNAYLGSFAVGGSGDIDQANESDGADVISAGLGPAFPNGLLVVQDGANDPQVVVEDDGEIENISTNFKFVAWEQVANAFPTPLLVDPGGYSPR
jgi:myo-inositol-hexaphosphate 3-phosphohydrolase